MLKIIIALAILTTSGNTGTLADFTQTFMCSIYKVRSAEFNAADTMNRLMFIEYKYVNKSLKLISTYRNRLTYQEKQEIDEFQGFFEKRRDLLDNVVGTNRDISLSNLSLLYNIYKDDNFGIAKDLFNIYGINKQKIRNLGDRLDNLDHNIKYKILDFAKKDPSINSLSCH